MIYLFPVHSDLNQESLLAEWCPLMSVQRYEKILKYYFLRDRFLSAAAFLLLRYALYREFHLTECPELIQHGNEKPLLKGSRICFNLSHCEKAVLCGISSKPVGVDVQEYQDSLWEYRKQIACENEQHLFSDEKSFTRLWTLKEAYGKYTGSGICYTLSGKDFSSIRNAEIFQKFNDIYVYSRETDQFTFSVFCEELLSVYEINETDIRQFAEYLKQ
ncbi:MAG: 4'-phosphopantetheinyl transferase superfamily protein [Oscillospiraceae bacterium]|nr:4'-phosphopantetheinyl transferase superfamily protein [Oscillospiraceae bacterium]